MTATQKTYYTNREIFWLKLRQWLWPALFLVLMIAGNVYSVAGAANLALVYCWFIIFIHTLIFFSGLMDNGSATIRDTTKYKLLHVQMFYTQFTLVVIAAWFGWLWISALLAIFSFCGCCMSHSIYLKTIKETKNG